jgi:integrase
METFWKQKKKSNQFLEIDTKYLVKIGKYYYFSFRHKQKIIKVSLKCQSLYEANIKKIQLIRRLEMNSNFNKFNLNDNLGVNTFANAGDDPKQIEDLNNKILNLINEEKQKGNLDGVKTIEFNTDNIIETTLKEAFELYVDMKIGENIGDESLKKYNTFYKYLLLFCDEDKKIHTFTSNFFKKMQNKILKFPARIIGLDKYKNSKYEDIMKDYEDKTYQKLSGKYINDMFEFYTLFFDFCEFEDFIVKVPVEFRRQKEKTDPYIPFTEKDLNTIFNEFHEKQPLINILFKVGLYTGMRIGEIANITKEDIDFKLNIIRITKSKTKAGIRVIPIHKNLLSLIKFHYENTEDDYLFSDKGNKNQFNKLMQNNVNKIITNSKKRFHSLRKNFTQKLYKKQQENLIHDNTIDRLLGHKVDSLSFDIYNLNEVDIKVLRDAIDCIEYPDSIFKVDKSMNFNFL